MDPKLALFVKLGLAGLGIVSMTVLAVVGKIDAAVVVDFVKWAVLTLMAGTAVLGGANAIANGMGGTPPPVSRFGMKKPHEPIIP